VRVVASRLAGEPPRSPGIKTDRTGGAGHDRNAGAVQLRQGDCRGLTVEVAQVQPHAAATQQRRDVGGHSLGVGPSAVGRRRVETHYLERRTAVPLDPAHTLGHPGGESASQTGLRPASGRADSDERARFGTRRNSLATTTGEQGDGERRGE